MIASDRSRGGPKAIEWPKAIVSLRFNVNEADRDQLDAVEGVAGNGLETVRYREERGHFTDLRQLDEVPGMSGVVDEAIRGRLTTTR